MVSVHQGSEFQFSAWAFTIPYFSIFAGLYSRAVANSFVLGVSTIGFGVFSEIKSHLWNLGYYSKPNISFVYPCCHIVAASRCHLCLSSQQCLGLDSVSSFDTRLSMAWVYLYNCHMAVNSSTCLSLILVPQFFLLKEWVAFPWIKFVSSVVLVSLNFFISSI